MEVPGAYDAVAATRVAGKDELAAGTSGSRTSCGAATAPYRTELSGSTARPLTPSLWPPDEAWSSSRTLVE